MKKWIMILLFLLFQPYFGFSEVYKCDFIVWLYYHPGSDYSKKRMDEIVERKSENGNQEVSQEVKAFENAITDLYLNGKRFVFPLTIYLELDNEIISKYAVKDYLSPVLNSDVIKGTDYSLKKTFVCDGENVERKTWSLNPVDGEWYFANRVVHTYQPTKPRVSCDDSIVQRILLAYSSLYNYVHQEALTHQWTDGWKDSIQTLHVGNRLQLEFNPNLNPAITAAHPEPMPITNYEFEIRNESYLLKNLEYSHPKGRDVKIELYRFSKMNITPEFFIIKSKE